MPWESFRCYALVWYLGLAILLGVMPGMGPLSPPRSAESVRADGTAVELAILTLARAPRLASAELGYGSAPSTERAALQILTEQPKAKSHLLRLIQQANPVGRLYGLIALQIVDPAQFERAAVVFGSFTDPIEVQQGCVTRTQTFKEIVADIQAGMWSKDLRLATRSR